MKPPFTLPIPTLELVLSECDEFDQENQLVEEALRQLHSRYPLNDKPSEVLLKVLVLNKLYSTRVNDQDVEPLALHITKFCIDPLLEQGSLNAVDRITDCPNMRKYFSFATKFCSWHNPMKFPIYDRNVDECLWLYKKQDGFKNFHSPGSLLLRGIGQNRNRL